MKILITGGCGYVGSVLINKLLNKNYKIINIDKQFFGNFLKQHKNLKNIKIDIQDISSLNLKNVDCIIHLASIANDPMSDLDPSLSWEVACVGTYKLLEAAIKYKIKKIIYASSSSVYGLKKEKKVTENLSLEPISLYNKTKMITERIIMSYKDSINYIIVRPATICGFSPRMRFDLTVNSLTWDAIKKKKIKVFGGKQIRPNIHIDDITDLYIFLLDNKKIKNKIYNAGFENLSILKIAKKIKEEINTKISVKKIFDIRSYKVSSNKLLKTGFKPKKNINDAIQELLELEKKNKIKNLPNFYSIQWLKKILKKKSEKKFN
jgi:nucleoside-diphosphate-sugar epimerase